MPNKYHERLYTAARAVEEFDHSRDRVFTGLVEMGNYVKPCGSPACVLGHYAARTDLQDEFELKLVSIPQPDGTVADRPMNTVYQKCTGKAVDFDSVPVQEHFGIDQDEAQELFSSSGCGISLMMDAVNGYGRAAPPAHVAAYLRQFADEKWGKQA